jgi:hypothetical protein
MFGNSPRRLPLAFIAFAIDTANSASSSLLNPRGGRYKSSVDFNTNFGFLLYRTSILLLILLFVLFKKFMVVTLPTQL